MGSPFQTKITPRHRRFDQLDERWTSQVLALTRDLTDPESGISLLEQGVSNGVKGGGTFEIILALSSAGSLTALKGALRLWLRRDKDRHIEVRYTDSNGEQTVVIEGSMDNDAVDRLFEGIAKRLES
ncbi:hypothetical protein ACFYRG_45355 [Streptomyces mirabilis]|uniref:hypothetical protein n=1 Tax=Streptomyces mirabilis TaxID=68239 RepID=UPI003697F0CA